MEARAKLSYARISPRKVKIVLDLIRNKPVGTALGILKNTPKAASELLEKLLDSAIEMCIRDSTSAPKHETAGGKPCPSSRRRTIRNTSPAKIITLISIIWRARRCVGPRE